MSRRKKRFNYKIADAKPKGCRSQYRCTLQGIRTLYNEIRNKLKKGHHDAIKKTPFRHFFKALHDNEIIKQKKSDKMLNSLILCYDRKTEKFKFGSEFYKPTRLDVKLIFGIEDGTKYVGKITGHGKGESKLAAKHFASVHRLSAKIVKDKAKELVDSEDQESIDDTVKLLCVILLHSVLFPNTGATIAWAFMHYVDDFEILNSYDWSRHVLDELMKGLHADWSNPKQVNGCTMLLLYWFCEHSDKIEDRYKKDEEKEPIKNGVQGISSKGIPRITKWDLKELGKLVEKGVLQKKDKKLFNKNELIPTNSEEFLIRSLNEKRKAKEFVIEVDPNFKESPADDETLMDVMRRMNNRVEMAEKKKEDSLGDCSEERPGVESWDNSERNQESGATQVKTWDSSEGNQESEATKVVKDIENVEELGDDSEGKSVAEAEKVHAESMECGFDMSDIPLSEYVEEPHDSPDGKSIAEAQQVHDVSMKHGFDAADQDEPNKKKKSRETITVLGKRKQRMTKESIKEKDGLDEDDKVEKLEEEISRLRGIVDSLKLEQMNLIEKHETMVDEHQEMQISLDEEIAKKAELLYELDNVKLAKKRLADELALAKLKIEQLEEPAKENETAKYVVSL